jgi:hypothetical protein
MAISVTDPIGWALTRTGRMLFKPFDGRKWFVLGFCAWLANLGVGGGPNINLRGGVPGGRRRRGGSAAPGACDPVGRGPGETGRATPDCDFAYARKSSHTLPGSRPFLHWTSPPSAAKILYHHEPLGETCRAGLDFLFPFSLVG